MELSLPGARPVSEILRAYGWVAELLTAAWAKAEAEWTVMGSGTKVVGTGAHTASLLVLHGVAA